MLKLCFSSGEASWCETSCACMHRWALRDDVVLNIVLYRNIITARTCDSWKIRQEDSVLWTETGRCYECDLRLVKGGVNRTGGGKMRRCIKQHFLPQVDLE